MIDYQATAGQHLNRVVQEMVRLAGTYDADVHTEFNGIELVARPGDSPYVIEDMYQAEVQFRGDQWRNSAEGKARADERRKEVERKQRTIDNLVTSLRTVLEQCASTDTDAWAIAWMREFATAADDIDVERPKDLILRCFARYGYLPNVNTGDDYRPDDRRGVAHYLIGQALSTMAVVGSPHPMFIDWADKWIAGDAI